MKLRWSHIGALALLGAALLHGTSGTTTPPESVPATPDTLMAYTLKDALMECQTLPDEFVTDCVEAAHATPWP